MASYLELLPADLRKQVYRALKDADLPTRITTGNKAKDWKEAYDDVKRIAKIIEGEKRRADWETSNPDLARRLLEEEEEVHGEFLERHQR